MRVILASTAAFAALASSALAADLPTSKPAPAFVAPAAVPTWTGFYVGATAGWAWGQTNFFDFEKTNPFNIKGFSGGGEVGYNYQFGSNFVAGLEADFQSGPSGRFGPGNLGAQNGSSWTCASGPCVTDVDWFGTARGRLGYAVGNALIYGTGGLAYGQVNSHIENSSTFTVSNTNTGWTAGAGVEYRFTPAISVKAEYLYVNLGWTPEPLSMKSYTDFGVARIGLNYNFGGP